MDDARDALTRARDVVRIRDAALDDLEPRRGVATDRRFFSRAELASGHISFKPDSLPDAAWGAAQALYDPLEVILK